MKTNCFILLLLVLAVSCGHVHAEQDIIHIDTDEHYPDFKVKVSDIAGYSFIKLESEESGLHISENHFVQVAVDEKRGHIILGQSIGSVFIGVFDMQGHLLHQIGRQGNAPGEFHQSFKMIFDEENDIITIYDKDKFIRYSSSGKLLGEIPSGFDMFRAVFFFQGDNPILFNESSMYLDLNPVEAKQKRGRVLTIMDKECLSEISVINHKWGRVWDRYNAWIYGNGLACYTKNGHLLSSSLSDTTYLFDHNFKLVPYMVDIRHNIKRKFALCPMVETKDYLFLTLLTSLGQEYPEEQRFFVIRKKDKRVFDCGSGLGFRLSTRDNPQFTPEMKTLTPGYCKYLIHVADLKECKSKGIPVPEEVLLLSQGMDEESNALLMLVHFN